MKHIHMERKMVPIESIRPESTLIYGVDCPLSMSRFWFAYFFSKNVNTAWK